MPIISKIFSGGAGGFGRRRGRGRINFSATGGSASIPGDGYKYHIFDSPGTLSVSGNVPLQAEVAMVGAGGNGGTPQGDGGPGNYDSGSGGGGGGAFASFVIEMAGGSLGEDVSYSINVGGGGASGNQQYSWGMQRENDYRSGTFVSNISGYSNLIVTVSYGWGGNLGGTLNQSLEIRDPSNNVVASGSGSGGSGTFVVSTSSLNPGTVYSFFSQATSTGGSFMERYAYGTIYWSGNYGGGGGSPTVFSTPYATIVANGGIAGPPSYRSDVPGGAGGTVSNPVSIPVIRSTAGFNGSGTLGADQAGPGGAAGHSSARSGEWWIPYMGPGAGGFGNFPAGTPGTPGTAYGGGGGGGAGQGGDPPRPGIGQGGGGSSGRLVLRYPVQ